MQHIHEKKPDEDFLGLGVRALAQIQHDFSRRKMKANQFRFQ